MLWTVSFQKLVAYVINCALLISYLNLAAISLYVLSDTSAIIRLDRLFPALATYQTLTSKYITGSHHTVILPVAARLSSSYLVNQQATSISACLLVCCGVRSSKVKLIAIRKDYCVFQCVVPDFAFSYGIKSVQTFSSWLSTLLVD